MHQYPFDTLSLPDIGLPPRSAVVVLAPHPDDFDAIAVSMRHLHQRGHAIHLAVLSSGANGVEDGWNDAHGTAAKAALREAEQRASCDFFGLPRTALRSCAFGKAPTSKRMRRRAGRRYAPTCMPEARTSYFCRMATIATAATGAFETFDAIAVAEGLRFHACLNLDAKTIAMRPDLYMFFDEEDAAWKAQLLRFHRSQQERNLKSRGQGFDQRVLRVNRQAAIDAAGAMPYAEVFEVCAYGG